jgi:DNA helicase HerA-like ATPase
MNVGTQNARVGFVDGSVSTTTQRYTVVLDEDALVQLDDVLVVNDELPGGRGALAHYGIVVEVAGLIEGASLSSDTQRIAGTRTMPGQRVSTVTVQALRTHPEIWVSPRPGAVVRPAVGEDRRRALFQDRMAGRELAVGLDHALLPVSLDWTFLNGERGAHMSISGISGVATKTSYALFVLYMLIESPVGRALLGGSLSATKAVVFNVKGEDLLHLDRPNAKFAADAEARAMWAALGVSDPKPFGSVRIMAPPFRSNGAVAAADVVSRRHTDYSVFAWTPLEFIARGLLQFVFSDARETSQLSFIVDSVRSALVRHAVPSSSTPGAVLMRGNPLRPRDFARASEQLLSAAPEQAQRGDVEIRDFADLVDLVTERIENDAQNGTGVWVPRTASGTNEAFLRRFMAMQRRMGQLVRCDASPLRLDRNVNVVDIHSLHDDAQRFVVGAVLDQIWQEKQGGGREPLRFVVLDELNKYAPRQGSSPIKEILVDIAARGRSLGVILVGCQQNASGVDGAITDNASVKVVGRLDAGHADEYRFLPTELRQRATRFLPGTMVLDQPAVPAPIPIRFPFPPYATNVAEDEIGAGVEGDPIADVVL